MRRFYALLMISFLIVCSWGQTQQGVVKTKGRMVNGKHVKGTPLAGSMVDIKGQNKVVVQNADGSFSFPTTNRSFFIQSVTKNGYQLVDADAAPKSYAYSTNPLILLLETPNQQAEDRLNAERKIRRTLQRQLQQREDELEGLRAQNKLSQEEYQKRLQQLYDDQQNNEKLITDMAKRYSELDFDQMDELNCQISDAILNGNLIRADSLLRTKGDIRQRAEELRQHEQANEQVRQDLEKSEALARQRREDLARDCYSRYELCKMQNNHDSAVYYLELRASVDTFNLKYQLDAADYLSILNYDKSAGRYRAKVANIFLHKTEEEKCKYVYDAIDMVRAYKGLAESLSIVGERDIGIKLFETVVNAIDETRKSYKEKDSSYIGYDLEFAEMKRYLAGMYRDAGRYEESERTYNEALTIFQMYVREHYDLESYIADVKLGVADLYFRTKRYKECEDILLEVQTTYRKLFAANQTKETQYFLSNTLYLLGKLYYSTKRYDVSEQAFQECVTLRKDLYDKIPQTYCVAYVGALKRLAFVYNKQKRYEEAYQKCDSAYGICRIMYRWQSNKYKNDLVETMGTLSFFALLTGRCDRAEDIARDALVGDSTQQWISVNLAAALLLQGKYGEAEAFYRQLNSGNKKGALDDLQLYAEAGVIPKNYEADVEKIKKMLNE